ncbi:hypothetical protein OUZ56_025521 [Daphnia magna]|uniref:Uncharacterized protein n=1 Tax=Daphnia magna TaxID=35525 RepID=A0ABQ9ZK48_9CRUS|nr:hypothetical protein OUZ56_025521 [Daphnia magna]
MKYCRGESQVVRLRIGCRKESELLEEENVVVWIFTTLCSLHTRVWQGNVKYVRGIPTTLYPIGTMSLSGLLRKDVSICRLVS